MHSDRPESHALRFAVRFEPDSPPEELMEFAQWVERLGYDELWFSEDLPFAGGIAMAATALACTERLRVGVGLLPAVTRNVATLAMEIAALARIAPGRVTMTLGHGVACLDGADRRLAPTAPVGAGGNHGRASSAAGR